MQVVAARTLSALKQQSRDYNLWGIAGETSMSYAPPRYPVFAFIGYRLDVWTRDVTNSAGLKSSQHEANSMITLGIGLQSGLR